MARGATNGGILVGDLAIQDDLRGGVIADGFVSQERYQALLQSPKAAFDFTFGLRAGSDPMGHTQGGEGALKLGTGIAVIGHGIMAQKAEAIGMDDQGYAVLEKEPAKMLEMIPRRIGRDKDCAQKFSGMILNGQQQGLLVGGRPPWVEGGIVLPEFARTGAFPAAAGFGAGCWLADEVGEMRLDKSGDRLAMTLEVKAEGQFIGGQLKVGRLLQGNEILQKLDGRRWPIWPMVPAGEFGAESGTLFQPAGAQPIKVRLTDLEVLGGFLAVDLPAIKQLQDMLEKGTGQALGQLFFSSFRMEPEDPLVEGLRRPPLRSGLLRPSTKGQFP